VIAFLARTLFARDFVLGHDYVRFLGTDAWYHMRAVDYMVRNFPRPIGFDAYALFPGGQEVALAPLLDWIVAGAALILGLGNPTAGLIDLAGALAPPVLGALVVLPVYRIGSVVGSPRVGYTAALLAALLPSAFLFRSLLGFTDHHVLEALLSTAAAAFLLTALREADRGRPSLRPALLAGLMLVLYLLAWVGAGFFVLVLFLGWTVVLLSARVRGGDPAAVTRIGLGLFVPPLVAALLCLGFIPMMRLQVTALGLAVAAVLALGGLAMVTRQRGLGGGAFLLLTVAMGAAGLVGLRLAAPDVFHSLAGRIQTHAFTGAMGTVSEAKPMDYGDLWEQYRVPLLLAPLGLVAIMVQWVREPRADRLLLVVWSAIMIQFTFVQARFAYYLVINIALLGAWTFWEFLNLARPRIPRPLRLPAAAVAVVLLLAPGIPHLLYVAHGAHGPSPGWVESLSWLRKNSPEPFGDADLYAKAGGRHDLPDQPGAYGVAANWDFGYWIARIAQRPPLANPTQSGAGAVARLFTETHPDTAAALADSLGAGYVLTHGYIPMLSDGLNWKGEIFPLLLWAEKSPRDVILLAYDPDLGRSRMLYLPDYYRLLANRLYLYDAAGYTPRRIHVVKLAPMTPPVGGARHRITAGRVFATQERANVFLAANPEFKMVGVDPFFSCVPLEPALGFSLVHDNGRDPGDPDHVKLFALRKGGIR